MVIWQSPHLPAPENRKETLRRVYTTAEKGNLRATPGEKWAAALGQAFASVAADASRSDRCYELRGTPLLLRFLNRKTTLAIAAADADNDWITSS
jgi:hypothetical protein